MNPPSSVIDNVKNICQNTAIIYAVKRLNRLPVKHSKLYYITFFSPLLLTRALWSEDVVSFHYKRFLMSLTYPDAKKITRNDVFRHCSDIHMPTDSCLNSFFENVKRTIKKTFLMYLKVYGANFLFAVLLSKKFRNRKLVKTYIENLVRSTLFLCCQTILSRALMCLVSNKKISPTAAKLYLINMVGAIPIVFERKVRTKQLNSLILSHLIIGQLRKSNLFSTALTNTTFAATLAFDSFKIATVPFVVSILTSLTFL